MRGDPASNILRGRIRTPRPYWVYLIMRGAGAFAFALIITYELVYHTKILGLNPIQLVTLGVVLESMTFLFEIPTGMVADLYSRRLAILLGVILIGLGFFVEGVIPTHFAALTAQVLWGIGFTFYSGAAEAWISDEVDEEVARQAYLRGAQIKQIFSLCGVGAGAYVVTFGLNWPIIIGAAVYLLLAIFLIFTMPEVGFTPSVKKTQATLWQKMISPISKTVAQLKTGPVLATIFAVGAVIGLSIGGFDRLYAAHILENYQLPPFASFDSVAWFSIMSGLIAVLSLVGTEIVRRSLKTADSKRVANFLFWIYGGMTIFTLYFAGTQMFYGAVVGFCISQAFRNVGRPLLIIWISQNTPSPIRATTISMYWQSNALGQIIGSPIIGWIGIAQSIKMAIIASGVIHSAVLPLIFLGGNQKSLVDE